MDAKTFEFFLRLVVIAAQMLVMLVSVFTITTAIYHMRKGAVELAYFFVFGAIFFKLLEIGLMLCVIVVAVISRSL